MKPSCTQGCQGMAALIRDGRVGMETRSVKRIFGKKAMKYVMMAVFVLFGSFMIVMGGCASVEVVPKELDDRVNYEVTFPQLLENPLGYTGTILVLGGQVLTARRLTDRTQIEVLQLPLDRGMKPVEPLRKSQGRFLAIQNTFLDPATLPAGTRITIVGEVTGVVKKPLDETTYDYPSLAVKRLTVWPPIPTARDIRPYPYVYPYWAPYWGPYWW